MTISSRGYRTLPATAAQVERWSVAVEDGPSYDNLPVATDWTYFQGIQASVEMLVDNANLHAPLGLADDAELGICLSWRTQRVGMRGSSQIVPIRQGEVSATTSIPPGHSGGILTLEARVVLLSPGRDTDDALAPRLKGSILWSDTWKVLLEGIAARLPIVPVPPGQAPFIDLHNARWFVKVEMTDLDAPIDAAVRVFINDANENVQRMMAEPGGETANAMTSSLLIDVQREFIRVALEDDGPFEPGRDYPDGSLGAALAASLKLFGDDYEELQARATYDSASFDVEVQGRLGEERVNG